MDTVIMQERIGQLCGQFKLPTVAAETVARFTAAGHGDALATFLEVLEQEAEDRRHRRINRLRRESRLPSGKTWETFEHHRVPLARLYAKFRGGNGCHHVGTPPLMAGVGGFFTIRCQR